MIGYVVAFAIGENNYPRVIVTIEIPKKTAKTTLNRTTNIVDKIHALYRCDKALVIDIEDVYGNKYNKAKTYLYDCKQLYYNLDQMTIEKDYVDNVDISFRNGIQFFIDKQTARLYNIANIEEDERKKWLQTEQNEAIQYREWHYNGSLYVLCSYLDGKLHGDYICWSLDGKISIKCNYINGKMHGEYKSWFSTENNEKDNLSLECNYNYGKLHGEYKSFRKDGSLSMILPYVNGKIHGEVLYIDKYNKIYKKQTYRDGRAIIEIKYPDFTEIFNDYVKAMIKVKKYC